MKNEDLYHLPMHVAAALTSGRVELLKLGPASLNDEAQIEVLRLLGDMIQERERAKERIRQLESSMKMYIQTSLGQLRRLESDLQVLSAEIGG